MLEPTRRPLRSRPLDAIYAAWFPLHIVIMLCVDMTTIYPQWMIPAPLSALREWQATNYKDRFFIDPPPPWFTLFIYLEALYHVPLSIWATRALIRGKDTFLFSPKRCPSYLLESLPCVFNVHNVCSNYRVKYQFPALAFESTLSVSVNCARICLTPLARFSHSPSTSSHLVIGNCYHDPRMHCRLQFVGKLFDSRSV